MGQELETTDIQAVESVDPVANKDLKRVRDNLGAMALVLSDEVKERFDDPKKLRKIINSMSMETILNLLHKIAMMDKGGNNIFLPKGVSLNLQQVNNYAATIATNRNQLLKIRDQAKREIKNIPR